MPAYITSKEYEDLTGRSPKDAKPLRLEMASFLLDARLGVTPFDDTKELALDLTASLVTALQKRIAKGWTAEMVRHLADNNDQIQPNEDISLGDFSVKAREGQSDYIPDSLAYWDQMLQNCGLIDRSISLHGRRRVFY